MKKLAGLALFFLLCISGCSLFGMNGFKNRFKNCSWKTAAFGAFAGTCTALHYGLSLFPSYKIYTINKHFFSTENRPDAPDVSPVIEQFVRQQLKKPTSKKILIKSGNQYAAKSSLDTGTMYLEDTALLEEVLATPQEERPNKYICWQRRDGTQLHKSYNEYLKQVAAIIQHEETHIVKHHYFQLHVAFGAIPFLLELAHYGLKKKFPVLGRYSINNVLKIPTGALKGYINGLIFFALSRYHEQQSDDGIEDNIQLLQADIEYQEELPSWRRLKHTPWYRNFHTHPADKLRIARLRQRLQVLEDTGDERYCQDPLQKKESEIK